MVEQILVGMERHFIPPGPLPAPRSGAYVGRVWFVGMWCMVRIIMVPTRVGSQSVLLIHSRERTHTNHLSVCIMGCQMEGASSTLPMRQPGDRCGP